MIKRCHKIKILNLVIGSIPIFVVNVVTIGNIAVVILPHGAMESFPFVLEITSAEIKRFSVKLLDRVADYLYFHMSLPPYLPTDHGRVSTRRLEA